VLHGRWFGALRQLPRLSEPRPEPPVAALSQRLRRRALFVQDDRVHTVATRLGHAAWHPVESSAFSRFDIQLFYHTARVQTRDAMDSDSLWATTGSIARR